MAISRAQMEEQIKGFNQGGINEIDALGSPIDPSVSAALSLDIDDLRKQVGLQSRRDEALSALDRSLQQAATTPSAADLTLDQPDFEDSFTKYQKQLKKIYGARQQRPIFYDLASTVGAAMLAADPTAGAFRSAGMGLAQFAKEQAAVRKQRAQEDRAIGLKAFELAKKDVDAATNLINEYRLLQAKSSASNKITEMEVADPAGIVIGGTLYEQGSRPLLTESEIYANREKLSPVSKPSTGWKVPDAGAIAIYQSREDAEKTIESLGLSKESPFFDSAVNQLVPLDSSLIGKRVISGGKYTELRPLVQGDQVYNVMLNTASGETTDFANYSKKRLDFIAKNEDKYVDKALTLLPEVDRALSILRSGVKTGKLTEVTFPIRQFFTQVFGVDDPEIKDLESLVGIANILATKIRPVGSGSTSDLEFRAYRQAILDLGKTPEANYIALYVYKKMTENAIAYNRAERNALTSGDFVESEQVDNKIKELDTGIFEKYTGDPNDNDEILAWMESLPMGAVFLNRDQKTGVPLIKGEDLYVIKGFVKE